jgi:hypothetical protein
VAYPEGSPLLAWIVDTVAHVFMCTSQRAILAYSV